MRKSVRKDVRKDVRKEGGFGEGADETAELGLWKKLETWLVGLYRTECVISCVCVCVCVRLGQATRASQPSCIFYEFKRIYLQLMLIDFGFRTIALVLASTRDCLPELSLSLSLSLCFLSLSRNWPRRDDSYVVPVPAPMSENTGRLE